MPARFRSACHGRRGTIAPGGGLFCVSCATSDDQITPWSRSAARNASKGAVAPVPYNGSGRPMMLAKKRHRHGPTAGPPKFRTCSVCGTEFLLASKNQRTCSKGCAGRAKHLAWAEHAQVIITPRSWAFRIECRRSPHSQRKGRGQEKTPPQPPGRATRSSDDCGVHLNR